MTIHHGQRTALISLTTVDCTIRYLWLFNFDNNNIVIVIECINHEKLMFYFSIHIILGHNCTISIIKQDLSYNGRVYIIQLITAIGELIR